MTEDTVLAATGNVLTNDASGADAPKPFASWDSALTGTYGTLVQGVTGAYTYTPNNASPPVPALATGETLTYTFTPPPT